MFLTIFYYGLSNQNWCDNILADEGWNEIAVKIVCQRNNESEIESECKLERFKKNIIGFISRS